MKFHRGVAATEMLQSSTFQIMHEEPSSSKDIWKAKLERHEQQSRKSSLLTALLILVSIVSMKYCLPLLFVSFGHKPSFLLDTFTALMFKTGSKSPLTSQIFLFRAQQTYRVVKNQTPELFQDAEKFGSTKPDIFTLHPTPNILVKLHCKAGTAFSTHP